MPHQTRRRGIESPSEPAAAEFAASGFRHAPSLRRLIDPDLWDQLVTGASTTRTPTGEMLYDVATSPPVLAMLDGVARVFMWTAGGRQLTLRYLRPGDVVGLGAALGDGIEVSTEAVTDTTAAVVSVEHLRELSAGHPELSWAIARQVAGWACDVVLAVADLEHRPMTARVAAHLLELATPASDGEFVVHVSHQGLADAAGSVREVVTRALRQLRETGVVDTRHGTVIIVDSIRLARIARGDDPPVHD